MDAGREALSQHEIAGSGNSTTHQSSQDALGRCKPYACPHQQVLDLGQGDEGRVSNGTCHCILKRVGKPKRGCSFQQEELGNGGTCTHTRGYTHT